MADGKKKKRKDEDQSVFSLIADKVNQLAQSGALGAKAKASSKKRRSMKDRNR